jgi:hypothetical protein
MTVAVGSVVWEQAPEDSDFERRGGIVVRTRIDPDTGEQTLTVMQARKRRNMREVYTTDLDYSDVDRATIEAPDVHRCYRTARAICAHLGDRQGSIDGHNRWLLETAIGLCLIADELTASRAAVVRSGVDEFNAALDARRDERGREAS